MILGIVRFWGNICLVLLSIVPSAHGENFQYLPELETVALKPVMRAEPYSATLYTLQTDTIAQLIDNVLVFDSIDEYQTLPYVVAFEEQRTLGHEGQIAFAKGLQKKDDYSEYSLLRPGREFRHPVTNERIGIQVFVNGSVVVKDFADPQKIFIKKAAAAVEINARLVPLVGIDLPVAFDVKYPTKAMSGYILALEQDVFAGGEYTTAIISLGSDDGLKQGNVLDIIDVPPEISDINTRGTIQLPNKKVGEVLIYKTGAKMSLAMITYSDRAIVVKDRVSVTEADF